MEWWEKPVRMMRLDYLDALQRMTKADLEELARWKKEEWNVNCEWVMGTSGMAPGLGYLTTFNATEFEKYPGLGEFDLIREYLPYARKYGIRVLAYLNMHWYSYDFAAKHSDWEQVTGDGRSYGRIHPLYGSGTTMCINSSWRNWSFELIEESMKTGIDGVFLDGPVVFPECCYCDSCREKFNSAYQSGMPKWEDWANPKWKDFLDFREVSMADYLRDAKEVVKRMNPKGVIFLNARGWRPGNWRVAGNIEKLSEYQNFNGAEAFFHPGTNPPPLFFSAIEAKHLLTEGKPAVVFTHHALGTWHYLPLPQFEAELAMAQTIACGANPWFAIFDYSLDHSSEESLRPIKNILGFMAKNEQYYTATASESDIALLISSQTSTFYLSELNELYLDPGTGVEKDLAIEGVTGEKKIDLAARKRICDELYSDCVLGFANMLWRNHFPFDVISDKHLKREPLGRYSTLILPNAACLDDAQIESISSFVKEGGRIISSFETASYDGRGRQRGKNPMWDLFGVDRIEGMMTPRVGEEYMRIVGVPERTTSIPEGKWIPRPSYTLKAIPKKNAFAPCIYLAPIGAYYSPPRGDSIYSAMVFNRYGLGTSIFFSNLIGEFYARYKMPSISGLVSDVMRTTGKKIPVVAVEAPGTVQFELRSQHNPRRLLIHLVNNTGEMERPFSNLIPVRNIKIKVNGRMPQRAFKLSDGKRLDPKEIANGILYEIEQLDVYEVIVIEP